MLYGFSIHQNRKAGSTLRFHSNPPVSNSATTVCPIDFLPGPAEVQQTAQREPDVQWAQTKCIVDKLFFQLTFFHFLCVFAICLGFQLLIFLLDLNQWDCWTQFNGQLLSDSGLENISGPRGPARLCAVPLLDPIGHTPEFRLVPPVPPLQWYHAPSQLLIGGGCGGCQRLWSNRKS